MFKTETLRNSASHHFFDHNVHPFFRYTLWSGVTRYRKTRRFDFKAILI